jgi:hypothetical protein
MGETKMERRLWSPVRRLLLHGEGGGKCNISNDKGEEHMEEREAVVSVEELVAADADMGDV